MYFSSWGSIHHVWQYKLTHTCMRSWPKLPNPSQIHAQHTPMVISQRTPLTGPIRACKLLGKLPDMSGPCNRPTSRIIVFALSWFLCSGAGLAEIPPFLRAGLTPSRSPREQLTKGILVFPSSKRRVSTTPLDQNLRNRSVARTANTLL